MVVMMMVIMVMMAVEMMMKVVVAMMASYAALVRKMTPRPAVSHKAGGRPCLARPHFLIKSHKTTLCPDSNRTPTLAIDAPTPIDTIHL